MEIEAEGTGLELRLGDITGVSQVERVGTDRYRLLADRDVRPDAARAVVNGGGQLKRLSVEEPSLEAIYAGFFQRQKAKEVRDAA